MPSSAISTIVRPRMLRTLSGLQPNTTLVKQVRSIFSFFLIESHCFATSLEEPQSPRSSAANERKCNQTDVSSIPSSGIAKSVILRCANLWERKSKSCNARSLTDHLLKLGNICPKVARRFWRVSELNPHHVLQILLSAKCISGKFGVEAEKVETLWRIFKWAAMQSKEFEHLPQSSKVMASMLVQAELFGDADLLLSTMERRGISLDCPEIYGNLIEGYAAGGALGRAFMVYDRMRALTLVPSSSCYCLLLKFLVQKSETLLALRVYLDMVELGLGTSNAEEEIYQNVVQLLCKDGKVQEARNLVKKVKTFGIKPSKLVINAITSEYCARRDYDDIVSFFTELKCVPDVVAGNKIIFSLCRNFGVERANVVMLELECLGFCPDETTFGIMIGWSCREGKLKNAFNFLSEILSRRQEPHLYSYNSLISAVFKKGMWKHARDILEEMDDRGITPALSTYRILLAGYCRARQFDEVKLMICRMENCGLVELSPQEDPLTKAFILLGLNPLAVKLRRDNSVGLLKTEFFDNTGNGLYLETDLDEYEGTMIAILNDGLFPDINALILKGCARVNVKMTMELVNDLVKWGQELSSPAFSAWMKGLCVSRINVTAVTNLLNKMPNFAQKLDRESLNLLVQAHSKRGLMYRARIIIDAMLQRRLVIENETYTSLIMGFCKEKNLEAICVFWKVARQENWLPELKDGKSLLDYLWSCEMHKEALELFESMLVVYPDVILGTVHAFLKKLCGTGFTSTADVLIEELLKHNCSLDQNTYSFLIRGFCKERRFPEAFMILDIMLAKSMAPNLDISVQLIPRLCRAGKLDKAIALKEIGLHDQYSSSLSVHCDLMNAFNRVGRVEEVVNLFHGILRSGLFPDAEVYNTLIQGCSQANNCWRAGEVLCLMIRKDANISISAYRTLVSVMCKEGRFSCALNMKLLMLKQNRTSSLIIYNILIFFLFSSGKSKFVHPLIDELKEKELELDGTTYNFLVYGFSLCKDLSSSVKYLIAMMSKELRPSSRCLRAAITGLCCNGDVLKALDLSCEIESRGWIIDSIIQNSIVERLISLGELQKAVNFLDRILAKGLVPDNINYNNLIEWLCRYGRQDKAADLLDTMLKKGNVPSSSTYDAIVQGFCKCLELDRALDFLTEMSNRNLRPHTKTWTFLVHQLCECGRSVEAEMFLNSMVRIGETPSREMYYAVINRYRYENDFSKASELLQAMQENGYEPDFETHWSLISNLSRSADKDSGNKNRHFLSRLLSESGFDRKGQKANLGSRNKTNSGL